jgi:RimJ/RimL family protein N-acetyltransferase
VRPITPIDGHDGLRLMPAGPTHLSEMVEGINESGDEIFQAMPWLELDQPIPNQASEYLHDVERYGKGGLSYHWAVQFRGETAGLIALDYTPHLVIGHWNLGYWIRPQFQCKGLAGHSIDAVLKWIGRGGLTSVEMAVNPTNNAGVKTAESAIKRWNGHRLSDEVEVEVMGQKIMHHCWLIPRLPLEEKQ